MEADQGTVEKGGEEAAGFVSEIYNEITSSPLNIGLLVAIMILLYKISRGRQEGGDSDSSARVEPALPKMKKRDMTLQEIRKYDGTQEDGRILVAINGTIFDVTKGKRFYGPGGPYSSFGGHDASRALAMFQTDLVKEEYDDLSDLDSRQMESVREWAAQLEDKYDVVGRLLKPGEEPTNYSEDEDENDDKSKSKDD